MRPEVTRFKENPIIRPEMLPGDAGKNINGPCLIRTPEWLPEPLGNYYLYFSHHRGTYIRLAYADRLEGPWTIHPSGSLSVENVLAVSGDEPGPAEALAGGEQVGVAAPNVHVDHARREIRMYFTVKTPRWGMGSGVARSNDGRHFKPLARPVSAAPYYQVFVWKGHHYALDFHGQVSRSPDGLEAFEALQPAGLDSLANGRKSATKGPLGAIRHAAVHADGETLNVFFSRYGDTPESIVLARIQLADDPKHWKLSEPIVVLAPELSYEGGELPLEPSAKGMAPDRVRQLRDPYLFQENGKRYLLYAVAGESGIAIAEYRDV